MVRKCNAVRGRGVVPFADCIHTAVMVAYDSTLLVCLSPKKIDSRNKNLLVRSKVVGFSRGTLCFYIGVLTSLVSVDYVEWLVDGKSEAYDVLT